MGSIGKITRLHFISAFNIQIIVCIAHLILNLLISVVVIRVLDAERPAGAGDFIALGWIFFIGLIFFIPGFRYTLSLGISRKKYFLSGSFSIFLLSMVLAVINQYYHAINSYSIHTLATFRLIA